MSEDYVSLKVARKLKEFGFNERCFTYYNKEGVLSWSKYMVTNSSMGTEEVVCPSIYQAARWMSKNLNYYIELVSIKNRHRTFTYRIHCSDFAGSYIGPLYQSKDDVPSDIADQLSIDGMAKAIELIEVNKNRKDYVNFYVAQFLYESGYNGMCCCFYNKRKMLCPCEGRAFFEGEYAAPLLNEAKRWLQNERGIRIAISANTNSKDATIYSFDIFEVNGAEPLYISGKNNSYMYNSYERCLNAAILEALKLI